MNGTKPPILFIIFNRLDCASRIFEAIREYQPAKLYVAADGPRPHVKEDAAQCAETRKIIERVDWPCEVMTFFRNDNQGTRLGVVNAINWFFQQEEEGIILEHDCLPGQEFFHFCADLLKRYRNDARVMHIGGSNLQFGQKRGNASYYFSSISSIWGWASWRRVWQLCDPAMQKFPAFESMDLMIDIFPERKTADWIMQMARNVYENKIVTWDYPLGFSIVINNGLCITPNVNLVSNIGFGEKAIHTKDASHPHADIPIGQLGAITHPMFFIPDRQADLYQISLSMPAVSHPEESKSSPGFFGKAKKSMEKLFNF